MTTVLVSASVATTSWTSTLVGRRQRSLTAVKLTSGLAVGKKMSGSEAMAKTSRILLAVTKDVSRAIAPRVAIRWRVEIWHLLSCIAVFFVTSGHQVGGVVLLLPQRITARVFAELEPGRFGWFQPWLSSSGGTPLGLPQCASTGRTYSGINILPVWAAAIEQGTGALQKPTAERIQFGGLAGWSCGTQWDCTHQSRLQKSTHLHRKDHHALEQKKKNRFHRHASDFRQSYRSGFSKVGVVSSNLIARSRSSPFE